MERDTPFELPLEPTVAPVKERDEHKPSIIEIEGVLEIIRKEEEEDVVEEKRKPTIH